MAVENANDLAGFFDPSEHGEVATIGASTINGIFSDEYSEILDVSGSVPVFTCITSELDEISPVVTAGTAIVIKSVNYTIEVLQPDGTGVTRLTLQDKS